MNTADAPATPAPPRWLAWLLSLPIAAGVLLATWFCLVLDRLRLVQIGLAVLVGYLLLRALASRLRVLRAPVRVLGAGWYALALAAWSVLAYPAYVIAPAQTAALLAAVVIAFALEQSRRTRWPWGALVLLAAAAAAWRQWHPYLWLLPAVAAVAWAAARWRPAWTPRGAKWLLLLWCAVIASILVSFYRGAPPLRLKEVLAQPGVTLVYDATNPRGPRYAALGPEPRFGRPDCAERILVGTRYGSSGLVRLEPRGPAGTDLGPVSDFAVLDCRRKRIIAGEASQPELRFFDHDTLALLRDQTLVATGLKHISELVYLPTMDQLYASGDDTKRLFMHDFRDGAEMVYDTKGFVTDFALFPEANRMVISSWGGQLYFHELAPDMIRLIGEMRIPDFLLQLTPDLDGRSLWITGLFGGELIKLSVLEQKVLARVRLGAGIRFCAIDAASDTLFVGNFFTGALTALDRKTLQPKWSRFLGARLRNVSVFPLARKLVAASALGLFEIKLP